MRPAEKLPDAIAPRGPLSVRHWSMAEWFARQAQWDELVQRACTDALFLSWDWLTNWWRVFGDMVGGNADVLAFYRGEQLVGIAPLYHRRLRRNGVLVTRSVQMIGIAWRDAGPLISEYLDVIATSEDLAAVREACVAHLVAQPDWNELVIAFTGTGTEWGEAYTQQARGGGRYVRELDRSVTYQADLSQGFAAYLKELRQSTRRSLWNLRRRLGTAGSVRLEAVGRAQLDGAFADLNRLHLLRWNKPAFVGKRLEFHRALAERLIETADLKMSRLWVNGKVVSVLYDVCKKARQYNIKMAFDPNFSTQVSLGLIHLGYAMELAAGEGVARYDFLAGPGRSSDFKRLLSQQRYELSCVQIVRGPVLPTLYRWRDHMRRFDSPPVE
ncbi:MAG: GNAT family N-acetyltransferase [Proteobacteria bacterium]|nr:GNAT family N-acetyltransferase [Pseudomonadota bacterium]